MHGMDPHAWRGPPARSMSVVPRRSMVKDSGWAAAHGRRRSARTPTAHPRPARPSQCGAARQWRYRIRERCGARSQRTRRASGRRWRAGAAGSCMRPRTSAPPRPSARPPRAQRARRRRARPCARRPPLRPRRPAASWLRTPRGSRAPSRRLPRRARRRIGRRQPRGARERDGAPCFRHAALRAARAAPLPRMLPRHPAGRLCRARPALRPAPARARPSKQRSTAAWHRRGAAAQRAVRGAGGSAQGGHRQRVRHRRRRRAPAPA